MTMGRKIYWNKILTKEFLKQEIVINCKSDRQIARKIGCDKSTIRKYRIKYKLPEKNIKPKNRYTWANILTYDFLHKELINKKQFVIDVAEKIECSSDTIYKYLKLHNLYAMFSKITLITKCINCGNEITCKRSRKKYCSKHCQKQYNYYQNHEKNLKYNNERYHKNRNKYLQSFKNKYKKLKEKILEIYGKQCECCGESITEFLTLEHKDGNGSKHRKQHKGSYVKIYQDAIMAKDKRKYGILCFNCNSIQLFGIKCPHIKNTIIQPNLLAMEPLSNYFGG
jgi:hypothetical protein